MYHKTNHRKFLLQAHIVIVTKYRRRLFSGSVPLSLKSTITELAQGLKFEVVTMETDKDHLHILISYDTTVCISDIVKHIKQKTTHHFWKKHPEIMRKHYWKKRILWSDCYFACSVGDASAETIQHYIENQG